MVVGIRDSERGREREGWVTQYWETQQLQMGCMANNKAASHKQLLAPGAVHRVWVFEGKAKASSTRCHLAPWHSLCIGHYVATMPCIPAYKRLKHVLFFCVGLQVDTFRAQPLQPECDKWCWFPVADRANAVQQWLNAVEKDPSMQKAPWLLLLETDYVWVKPLQVRTCIHACYMAAGMPEQLCHLSS